MGRFPLLSRHTEQSGWSRTECSNPTPKLSLIPLLRGNRTEKTIPEVPVRCPCPTRACVRGRRAEVRHTLRSQSGLGSNPSLPTVPHLRTLSKHPDMLHPFLLLYHGTHVLGRGGAGSLPVRLLSRGSSPMGLSAAPGVTRSFQVLTLYPRNSSTSSVTFFSPVAWPEPAHPGDPHSVRSGHPSPVSFPAAPPGRLLPTSTPDLEAHCSVTSSGKPPDLIGATLLNCPPEAP